MDKLEKNELIQPYKLEESQSRYVSGKDVYEFTSNMSASLKIDEPGFMKVIAGGSLNVAFGGSNAYSSDYSFAYFTQKYVDSRYRITESDINVLRECLTSQFINRISTYTPAQIVEEYGTHVLKDIYVGAKLEVYYMSKSVTTSKKQNVEAGLGVSLANIFKIDAKFHYDSSLATNNKQQSCLLYTSYRIELENSSFVIELDRFVKRGGIRYDRILSKWAIFKEEDGVDRLVSHARYVDEIPALQYLEPIKPVSYTHLRRG